MTGMATVQRRVNSVVMIKRIFSGRIILFLFLLLLVLLPVTSASSSSSSSALSADGNALLKFKEGITDDPHNMLCNWTHHNLHRFCVDWDGVRCNFSFASAAAASSSGGPSPFTLPRVVSLNLSNFQLSGAISPFLSNLTLLSYLDLSSNKFSGSIPSQIGQLNQLQHLDLWSNSLAGPIPSQICELNKLQYLDLSENNFSGPIPSQIGQLTKLKSFYVSGNLSLQDLIPKSLINCSSLQTLNIYLSANKPTPIPSWLGHLSHLQELGVKANVSSAIPRELGSLSKLQYLSMHFNGGSSSIPSFLGNLTQLKSLYLWGDYFTGAIPRELGNLQRLTDLYLRSDKLTGNIPSELGRLSQLTHFGLHANSMTGIIPPSLCNLKQVTILILVVGHQGAIPIPNCIGFMSRLAVLEASSNKIPKSIGNLTNLVYLVIESQNLEILPKELCRLKQLQSLNVTDSNASSSILGCIGIRKPAEWANSKEYRKTGKFDVSRCF